MAKKTRTKKVILAKPVGYVFGRPTKYKPEYCNLEAYLGYCKGNNKLPSKCGYAVFLNIAKDIINEWGKSYPDFSASLSRLLMIEQECLIGNGLDGSWKSVIVKLILSSNHGFVERIDQTTGGEKIQQEPLSLEDMKARIAAAEAVGLSGLDHRSISGGGQSENGR